MNAGRNVICLVAPSVLLLLHVQGCSPTAKIGVPTVQDILKKRHSTGLGPHDFLVFRDPQTGTDIFTEGTGAFSVQAFDSDGKIGLLVHFNTFREIAGARKCQLVRTFWFDKNGILSGQGRILFRAALPEKVRSCRNASEFGQSFGEPTNTWTSGATQMRLSRYMDGSGNDPNEIYVWFDPATKAPKVIMYASEAFTDFDEPLGNLAVGLEIAR